jgi:uncharacterized membrane protein YhaH (DUF805 family)
MRLSRYAQTPVAPRDFWIAVLVIALVLGGVGIYTTQSANGFRFPHVPLLWAGLLLCVWLVTVAALAVRWRRGRLARDSWQAPATLLAYTLFVSDKLTPHSAQWLSCTSTIGAIMIGVMMLLPYIDFGRKPRGRAANQAETPDGL